MGVQHVMLEMEKLQARGEVPEEELKALEMDMTGKVCFGPFIDVTKPNHPIPDYVSILAGHSF